MTPEPIRQAVIPWEIFTDEVVAVAMDGDGDWAAYTLRPECGSQYWQSGGEGILINHIKFDRGSEPDWRNTLQMRPGYEVK
jgi:hypothetical protein